MLRNIETAILWRQVASVTRMSSHSLPSLLYSPVERKGKEGNSDIHGEPSYSLEVGDIFVVKGKMGGLTPFYFLSLDVDDAERKQTELGESLVVIELGKNEFGWSYAKVLTGTGMIGYITTLPLKR